MDKIKKKNDSADAALKYIKYGLAGLVILVIAVIVFGIYYSYSTSYVAAVGSEKISTAEFNFFLKNIEKDMLSKAPNADPKTFFDSKIDGETASVVARKKALDSAKDLKVQVIKAKQQNITLDKAALDKIDQSIKGLVEQYKGKAAANEFLKSNYGINVDELNGLYKEFFLVNKLRQKEMESIKASVDETEPYYKKFPDQFKNSELRKDGQEAVWARHILLLTKDEKTKDDLPADKQEEAKKKAEGILARINGGEDFVKLAKENSQDPGSAQYGGDYIFGKGYMDPEFEKTAFGLNPGQVSNVIKTSYGYHIIRLEEKIPQGQAVSLKCAKEYREFGVAAVKNAKYQEKLDGWKNEYKTEINKKVFDSIKL